MEPSGEIYATIAWRKFIEKSIIQIPGQKNAKNELEKIQADWKRADEAYEGNRTKNYSEMDRMLGR